jgi:hypothetical protein
VGPWGSVALATWRPLSAGVATGFIDGLRSLGRCGSLSDSGHGVQFFFSFLSLIVVSLSPGKPHFQLK